MENEEIIALVDKGEINSTMSNKAIIEFLKPEKRIESKEAETAKAEAETAKAEAEAAKAEAEAAKDVWNSDLYEINQLANFILEVCSRHASSGVVKEIKASVEEIERLSHAE